MGGRREKRRMERQLGLLVQVINRTAISFHAVSVANKAERQVIMKAEREGGGSREEVGGGGLKQSNYEGGERRWKGAGKKWGVGGG